MINCLIISKMRFDKMGLSLTPALSRESGGNYGAYFTYFGSQYIFV